MKTIRLLFVLFVLILGISCSSPHSQKKDYKGWRSYLGDPGRSHYSTLSQITKENIAQLKLALEL